MKIKFNIILGIVICFLLISDLTRLLKQLTAQSNDPSALPSPLTSPTSQLNSPSPKPTSTPLNSGILDKKTTNGWKIFRSSNNYEFSFPSEWQEDPDNKSYTGNTKLIYYADGEKFTFSVADGGGGGPLADEIKNSLIYLDGNKFTKRLWIKDGYVFFVAVIPVSNSYRDPTSTVSSNVENINYTLPREKNTQYQELMDQVLATFNFFDKK